MASVVALLSHYPPWLMDRLCDPFDGAATRYTFFPDLKELKKECEALYAHVRRDQERERIRAETKFLLAGPPDEPREQRLGYDELKAKHGDGKGGWGIGPPRERPGFKPIPIEELHAMAGDQWDKIPDAPLPDQWQQIGKGIK